MLEKLPSYTALTAGFVDGERGRLFTLYFPPAAHIDPRQLVLHLPAMADEMNKSRAQAARQARAFAAQGLAVLLIDPWGTGDSEGEFADADWLLWQRDFAAICRTLQQDWILHLWGVRTGALMALSLAQTPELKFNAVLFWQPVLNGDLFLQQWLRLRIAGQLHLEQKEKMADLKQRLLQGETLEVGGYAINSALAQALLGLNADSIKQLAVRQLMILEIGADAEAAVSMPVQRWLQQLETPSAANAQTVAGIPFWNSLEIVVVDDFIRLSCQFFQGCPT